MAAAETFDNAAGHIAPRHLFETERRFYFELPVTGGYEAGDQVSIEITGADGQARTKTEHPLIWRPA